MATGLGDIISSVLSPDLVSKASSLVGESPETTRRGLEAAVPTVLSGLLNQTSGHDGASVLSGLLGTSGVGAGLLDKAGSMLDGGTETEGLLKTGSRLLSSMFGSGLSGIVDKISSFAGLRPSSGSSLLALAVPLVLSFLNRHKANRGLSTSGLLDQLRDQRGVISGLMPGELSRLIPTERVAERVAAERVTTERPRVSPVYERERERVVPTPAWRRWLPLLVLAAVGIPLLLWLAGRGGREVARDVRDGNGNGVLTLPGGARISAVERTLPYELATYLAGTSRDVPRTFTFDRLSFEAGTSRVSADSLRTIGDVAAILKAYPRVAIRVEGHTDDTGDAQENMTLSQARADEVRSRLIAAGIAGNRIEAMGYGSSRPVATNDTLEGRARNRRTDVVVIQR